MSVAKIVELVGSSEKSWEDAVQTAVSRMAKTVRGVRGVEVIGWTAIVENAIIKEYRATVKISFRVDEGV
jgi:hypothetical protein